MIGVLGASESRSSSPRSLYINYEPASLGPAAAARHQVDRRCVTTYVGGGPAGSVRKSGRPEHQAAVVPGGRDSMPRRSAGPRAGPASTRRARPAGGPVTGVTIQVQQSRWWRLPVSRPGRA
jgi:hypothetical protein